MNFLLYWSWYLSIENSRKHLSFLYFCGSDLLCRCCVTSRISSPCWSNAHFVYHAASSIFWNHLIS